MAEKTQNTQGYPIAPVMSITPVISITEAIAAYLDSVSLARSANTARTYGNALQAFSALLENKKIKIAEKPVSELSEDAIAWFAVYLKDFAPTTEALYLTAVAGFYEFLAAERLAEPNLPRLRLLIRQRSRKPGQRLPQFPRNHIEDILEYAKEIAGQPTQNPAERLRNLRDRAFLLTLADTGLRVHEACNLRRGDLDMNESRALIIGKGDRQAVVRFSQRSLQAIKDYLHARSELDGASGRPLSSLPLFARHDLGAGKKIKPITTATGRNIVNQRTKEAISDPAAAGAIIPPLLPPLFCHHRAARLRRQPQAGAGTGAPQEHRRHPALRPSIG